MKKAIVIGAMLFLSAPVLAQEVISNQSLIEMKKAGLSDDIIRTKIATEESRFDTSTNAILELKNNGFSDETINLIIQKNAALKSYSERYDMNVTNNSAHYSLITSIIERENQLIINDKIIISKGSDIQIHLPADKDFVFVTQKSGLLSTKLLGKVADAVGTGATAVGVGSGNIKTILGASKVLQGANAVKYGADALEKIKDLPISDKAKKIAGKIMKVTGWDFTDDNWIITAEYSKKKYQIQLQDAVLVGEVKLNK